MITATALDRNREQMVLLGQWHTCAIRCVLEDSLFVITTNFLIHRSFFFSYCTLRQWRRGTCRSNYNTTSARLSVLWSVTPLSSPFCVLPTLFGSLLSPFGCPECPGCPVRASRPGGGLFATYYGRVTLEGSQFKFLKGRLEGSLGGEGRGSSRSILWSATPTAQMSGETFLSGITLKSIPTCLHHRVTYACSCLPSLMGGATQTLQQCTNIDLQLKTKPRLTTSYCRRKADGSATSETL